MLTAEYRRKWRKKNPSSNKESQARWRANNPDYFRAKHLENKYGLTEAEFAAMQMEQQNRCAICLRFMDMPCVDHDHRCCPGAKSCGKCIRKLLCQQCNRGIGHFGDDPKLVEAALKYLQEE